MITATNWQHERTKQLLGYGEQGSGKEKTCVQQKHKKQKEKSWRPSQPNNLGSRTSGRMPLHALDTSPRRTCTSGDRYDLISERMKEISASVGTGFSCTGQGTSVVPERGGALSREQVERKEGECTRGSGEKKATQGRREEQGSGKTESAGGGVRSEQDRNTPATTAPAQGMKKITRPSDVCGSIRPILRGLTKRGQSLDKTKLRTTNAKKQKAQDRTKEERQNKTKRTDTLGSYTNTRRRNDKIEVESQTNTRWQPVLVRQHELGLHKKKTTTRQDRLKAQQRLDGNL